jgi:hypothetical protein
MRRTISIVLVTAFMVTTVGVLAIARGNAQQPAREETRKPVVVKWEYKMIGTNDAKEVALAGEEGWEAYAASDDRGHGHRIFFKRVKN